MQGLMLFLIWVLGEHEARHENLKTISNTEHGSLSISKTVDSPLESLVNPANIHPKALASKECPIR